MNKLFFNLALLLFVLFSCGDKDQSNSIQSSETTTPSVVLSQDEAKERAHSLLNLMYIYLNNKDSKLENGKEEEIKNTITQLQNTIKQNPLGGKTKEVRDSLDELRKYKGQFVLEEVNWQKSGTNELSLDELWDLEQSKSDLWILEKKLIESVVDAALIMNNSVSIKTEVEDDELTSLLQPDNKKRIQGLISAFDDIVKLIRGGEFDSLKEKCSDLLMPRTDVKSSYTLRNRYRDEKNDYIRSHFYNRNDISSNAYSLKEKIKEKHLKLHSSPISEGQMAFYLKTIFGMGHYDEFFEDMKKVIRLAFQGKRYSVNKYSIYYDKGKEILEIMKKYDLRGWDNNPSILQFTINQKQKWFDSIIDDLRWSFYL